MGVLKAWDGTTWRKIGCGDPSPIVYFSDDFNRANSSSLGDPWIVVNDDGTTTSALFGIDTNRAQPQSSVNDSNNVVAYVDSLGSDVDVQVTLAAVGNNSAVAVRLDPSIMRYFYFYFGLSPGWVVKTGTSIGTYHPVSAMLASAGDVVRIVAVGDNWTVYRNGIVVTTFTNSLNNTAVAHGLVGIPLSDSVTRFDDFTVSASTPAAGRLRLQLPDGSWVREVCDTDAGATFTDDFNRADSTTTVSNAAWVPWNSAGAPSSSYPWGIRSGSAYANGPVNGVDNILYYDVGTTDYDFTATYTGASGVDYGVGLVFSMDTASGGTYRLWTNNGIGGRDAGLGTGMIITGYPSIVAGDVLRIVCVGTTITLRLNGTVVDTITNGWATTGGATRVGLYGVFGDVGGSWDDVTIIGGVEKHPLKIEDPASPGTWITVACMTPV